jgi:hypothetical protein
MNLPEYRRGVRTAQDRFQKSISVAAEELSAELRNLEEQFFDDPNTEAAQLERR